MSKITPYKCKYDVANGVSFCFPILLIIQQVKSHCQMVYGTPGAVVVGRGRKAWHARKGDRELLGFYCLKAFVSGIKIWKDIDCSPYIALFLKWETENRG